MTTSKDLLKRFPTKYQTPHETLFIELFARLEQSEAENAKLEGQVEFLKGRVSTLHRGLKDLEAYVDTK